MRRALSHLVDKQNIVEKINHGLAVPVESPVFVERVEYNRSLAPYSFDPDRAKGTARFRREPPSCLPSDVSDRLLCRFLLGHGFLLPSEPGTLS